MSRQPFKVGDKVSVIRTRHGWYDGSLHAQVEQCRQRDTGTWTYLVRDLEGDLHDVQHTRDMRLRNYP